MPHPPDQLGLESCELIPAEQDLLAAPGVARVRIMGINALGILHRCQGDLVALLARGGALDVLLLDRRSAAFSRRRDSEEKRSGRVSNRLLREMEASMAILRDILNILLNEHGFDLDTLAQRYRVRLYDQMPTAALLFVDTGDGGVLLCRDLPSRVHATIGPARGHRVVEGAMDGVHARHGHYFDAVWAASKPVPLEIFEAGLVVVSPEKEDLPHVYAQAVEMHKKRHLDEASALYRTVLHLEGPAAPGESQIAAARRHLPRLYTTRGEPFDLKDLVAVIHPDPERRLIGYHLIWEDDIDFLDDNDPADHEVVWIRYTADGAIEGAWSYWHGRILTTGGAVADANAHGGRVRVDSQWGKHGSLLSGWEEKVGVDEAVPGYPEYKTMEFTRLTKGRKPSVGAYPDRWPKRFEGSREDFLDFAVEIDMEKKLLEHQMIVASRYANAVISQWYLPYNIRPKDDWPHDTDGAGTRGRGAAVPAG